MLEFDMPALRDRLLRSSIEAALEDTRVVVVVGARQVGKSTLVKLVVRERVGTEVRRLDRPSDLAAARADPESFVRSHALLVIDEIQRAPELVLPIKARVDDDNRPGQFLLTGSARLLGLRNLPDSLIGRSETIELWPFSQGELEGRIDRFVDTAFADAPLPARSSTMTKTDYLDRALSGGYPEATQRIGSRREKFFDSYVNDLIDRDITQLSEIQRRPDLIRLLALLADRMATPISVQNLAETLSVPKSTVDRYLTLLEEVFVVKRLSGWATSATSRATQQSKLFFVDSGLAAHLAGHSATARSRDDAAVGQLLENFVIGEVCRQLGWAEVSARPYHFRDRDKREVDLVLESRDGRVVAIEVKAGATVRAEDTRHLRYLRDALGQRFHRGIVLTTGDRAWRVADRIDVAPIDSLWTSPFG
jgi:uncharacterized protein